MGDCLISRRGGAVSNKRLPAFTYTGDAEAFNEEGGWRIKFLTSGVFTCERKVAIDVFCVGGGGGGGHISGGGAGSAGGGGGYTKSLLGTVCNLGQPYEIVVGAGGDSVTDGGASSGFNCSAEGGKHGGTSTTRVGGAGGSGGGGGGVAGIGGNGGSDGGDGAGGSTNSIHAGGDGQGSTTREFAESSGTLYAGGGGGGGNTGGTGGEGGGGNGHSGKATAPTDGSPNTGGGGGGGGKVSGQGAANYDHPGGKGGSGIVIIRNARGGR